MFHELVNLLAHRGWTVCAAESCTGGLFAAGIVSVPDASKVLERSFVTYSEQAKTELVGVPPETIEDFGVVSEETAAAMAEGAAAAAGADVGVGITGYAGPGGGDRFAERGTVCFGFRIEDRTVTVRKYYPNDDRNTIREKSAAFACLELTRLLKENG